jgi:hypothetical protein
MTIKIGAKTSKSTVRVGSTTKKSSLTKIIPTKSQSSIMARNPSLKPLAIKTSAPIPGVKANPIIVSTVVKQNARITITPKSNLNTIKNPSKTVTDNYQIQPKSIVNKYKLPSKLNTPLKTMSVNSDRLIINNGTLTFPDSYIQQSIKFGKIAIPAVKLIKDNPTLSTEAIVAVLYPEMKDTDQGFKNAINTINSNIKNNDYSSLNSIKIWVYPDGSYSRGYDKNNAGSVKTKTFNNLLFKYGGSMKDDEISFKTPIELRSFLKDYDKHVTT